ncbi:MAG: response regulator transcription factor [SAR202 cluster bacterium]|jgi:DNA-binding NarL/FixJ family response regulator|nr:response regulator transcription factor [SAR202 cluster bacterium]MDP6513885.1 response regulator transcription factor [SAR202 cluster bacterium]MDP6715318.1 response regulator transcription factor [SAR202 cluster bacterium]
MEQKIRVLIVDDERFFAEMLNRSLEGEANIEVVGVAHDARAALEMEDQHDPDAILMDIELPGDMDGIEAAVQIKRAKPGTGIVILSAHNERRYVTSLPLESTSGWAYLLKQTVPDVSAVVRAIEGSMNGMMVLDPAVVMNLQPRQGSAVARLTNRQRQVLELIAQGYNNAAIAGELVLTEKSVETYINAIYQELGVSREQGIHSRVTATLAYLNDTQSL